LQEASLRQRFGAEGLQMGSAESTRKREFFSLPKDMKTILIYIPILDGKPHEASSWLVAVFIGANNDALQNISAF
jgi:hypothetical protein